MPWDESMTSLRNVLAALYPLVQDSIRIVDAAGLPRAQMRFDAAAINNWHSILDEASKAKFAAKYEVNFPLLADADHAVAEKYGAWQERSMYGRKYMGVARTTYLIDRDGTVAQRWDKVKVDGHADEVLAAIKTL